MEQLNWFLNPIKQHYFDFDGRVGKQEYWQYAIWVIGISIILRFFAPYIIAYAFSLAVLLPSLGLGARRLHDTNLSGWWQLVGIIPIIGWIILIVLLIKPSDPGVNAYDIGGSVGEAGTKPSPETISTQMNKVVDSVKSTVNKVSDTLDIKTKSDTSNGSASQTTVETSNANEGIKSEKPKS